MMRLTDGRVVVGHDRDGRVFIDAVDHEVERSRSSEIREDGVERRFDAEQRNR